MAIVAIVAIASQTLRSPSSWSYVSPVAGWPVWNPYAKGLMSCGSLAMKIK